MSRYVTASVTVSFSDKDQAGGSGYLSAKVISEGPHVHSEPVTIRCYHAPNTSIVRAIPSAGSVSGAGSGTEEQETTITFTGSKEASIPKYADSIVGYSWEGRSLGSVTFDLSQGKAIVSVDPEQAFGVLKVKFRVRYSDYQLSSVPQSIKQVVVGFVGQIQNN